MRARLVAAVLLLLAATPGLGQDAPPPRERERRDQDGAPRERRRLTPEQRARLLERYRSLPPEERARLRRLYDEHVRGRSPDELEAMRRRLRERLPREAADAEARRRRFEQRPRDERLKYERLHHRLLQQLPPDERRELLQLPPAERKKRLQRLVQEHRRRVVEQRVRHLPADVRREVQADLETLEPRERFRRAREATEGHARDQLRRILGDESLTNEQKARRVQELLRRFVPDEQRREQLRRRVVAELQRRRERGRDGEQRGERRDQPGDRDRPAGDGDRPRRGPRRQQ